MKKIFSLLAFLILPLFSQEEGIQLNLTHPVFEEGVLKTEIGGEISGPDFRIQARKIIYRGLPDSTSASGSIEAEGDLIVEFGSYLFVGQKLTYNFATKRGVIFHGRTGNPPWYFGAETIILCPDGSYTLQNGYITTSENLKSDWKISTSQAHVSEDLYLKANHVQFKIKDIPLFYLPAFRVDLDTLFDAPVRYIVRWGGRQGPRVGMIYEIFSWDRLKNYLRIDYRLKRGLGGGFETHYRSCDHKQELHAINYLAKDLSVIDPDQHTRYRFQGSYNHLMMCDRAQIELTYDKLSDKEMATDYHDKTLLIKKAGRTQLHGRYEDPDWVGNFLARVRINSFQTVKQELPTLQTNWKPYPIGNTGILIDQYIKLSYLDFEYAIKGPNVRDYNSSRFEYTFNLYRPFGDQVTFTPEAGLISIFYGNSPNKDPKWLTLSLLGAELKTKAFRHYGQTKHVIYPYLSYKYYSWPTVNPEDHYIFDIADGWFRLNQLTLGTRHYFLKKSNTDICRNVMIDIFTNAFFAEGNFPDTLPKLYLQGHFFPFKTVRQSLSCAWDFAHDTVDHINTLTEWTVSKDFAFAFEYRHRSKFDWRKVDRSNFFLDAFRSVKELEGSPLSDRRDTALLRFYYQIHPRWGIRFQSRSGWNRLTEPGYNEFQLDLIGRFPSAWNIKFSYRHEEDDDRIGFTLTIGQKTPCPEKNASRIPLVEF